MAICTEVSIVEWPWSEATCALLSSAATSTLLRLAAHGTPVSAPSVSGLMNLIHDAGSTPCGFRGPVLFRYLDSPSDVQRLVGLEACPPILVKS